MLQVLKLAEANVRVRDESAKALMALAAHQGAGCAWVAAAVLVCAYARLRASVSLSVLCGMGVHSHGSARLCREQSQACVLKRSLSVFYRC